MEKIKNRADYRDNFVEFCKIVKLNNEFMDSLREHKYFREHMENIDVCN
jgi:hypothetical protein